MGLTRRQFLASASLAATAPKGVKDKPVQQVYPFPLQQIRLLYGPFRQAMEKNREFLRGLEPDRLLHTFRRTAGLASTAEPLGGWERPDAELRGHFTGHYLSACALNYAGDGDDNLRSRGRAVVAELAKCQKAHSDGYLSAFPKEFVDRLREGQPAGAPFCALHKILAGLLDMHKLGGDSQALEVAEGLGRWIANWLKPLGPEQMARVLEADYGGMSEALYDLYAATGREVYADAAHRFDDARFLDPLIEGRDELQGLRVSAQISRILGALRRFELTGDRRYWRAAFIFWRQVTEQRAYSTGGVGNFGRWRTEPGRFATELSAETQECCCTYDMLRLTRRLFALHPVGSYPDYHERALFNAVLGAINPQDGMTMYYAPLASGYWKLFSTPRNSFWCCTGAGVEAFSRLGEGVYFHDDAGIYVNLFIASELDWRERQIRIRQETSFPEQPGTVLYYQSERSCRLALRIRVPWWARSFSVRVNGERWSMPRALGEYCTVDRSWYDGDRVEVIAPMTLRTEPLPDDKTLQAFLYGPLVLAGRLGSEGLTREMQYGGADGSHQLAGDPAPAPEFRASSNSLNFWVKPVYGRPLTFSTTGQERDVTLVPFYRLFEQRYAVYWRVRNYEVD